MGVSAVATRRAESAFGVAEAGPLAVTAGMARTDTCAANGAAKRWAGRSVTRDSRRYRMAGDAIDRCRFRTRRVGRRDWLGCDGGNGGMGAPRCL